MSTQTGSVAMLTLAVEDDPLVTPGVHLRWSVDPELGFPPLGFNVFRRAHRPGTASGVDFTAEPEATLPASFVRGATSWSTADPQETSRFREELANGTTVSVLAQARDSALTCRLAKSERPARRIELDLVHSLPPSQNPQPRDFDAWGIAGEQRVTSASVRFTQQNRWNVLTLTLAADALDGFQIEGRRGIVAFYGILRVRWVKVSDEADADWGAPLNPRRIGLPVTAPGYLVTHAYSPDPGDGSADWHEAADRLSPVGAAAQPPPALVQRFGPPTFDGTRTVMRQALTRAPLVGPASPQQPRVRLDPVRLLQLGAIDPDFARLAGLGRMDFTAASGQTYDYKVVGYWPGPLRPQLVCLQVPGGGGAIPPGGSITIGGGAGGGAPIVVTVTTVATTPVPTPVVLLPTVAWPPALPASAVPGLVVTSGTAGTGPTTGPTTGPALTAPARRSLTFAFTEPSDRVRVVAGGGPPEPLVVMGLVGQTVVGVQVVPPGPAREVTLQSPGATSVVVSGLDTVVHEVCRLELVREQVEEVWICFAVTRGAVPAATVPGPIAGRVLPGFARDGRPEHLVGLTLEPPEPTPSARDLLPRARRPHDPVTYEVARRADGAQPVLDPAAASWGTLAAAGARPRLRSAVTPSGHRSPSGWPVEPQDVLDDGLDPDVRYYSYRARGRDLFGRLSDWSAVASVDAADTVAPPVPDRVLARWIERADPWLAADDSARLARAGVAGGVLVRWSWPATRRAQAPDAAGFRVYWHDRPFTSLDGTIASVQAAGATYVALVAFGGLTGPPPAAAFAGDWLRQGERQYRVIASTAAQPAALTLSATDAPAPVPGPCAVSLRGPDPRRLDLRGNPLRPEPASPAPWLRRLRAVPLVAEPLSVTAHVEGVAVDIAEALDDTPRPGLTTLTLTAGWTWSGELPDDLEAVVDGLALAVASGGPGAAGTLILAGSLPVGAARTAARLRRPLAPGAPGQLHTVEVAETLPQGHGATLVGGVLEVDGTAHAVRAHRADTRSLVIEGVPKGAAAQWFPDYELVLDEVSLPVTAAAPHATAMVGVSAVDGRPYAADRRTRPGEPSGPGNEGPIAVVSIARDYRGVPTEQATPAGTMGPAELWAPPPDEFSGRSRFVLRWPATAEPAVVVAHAGLDAVLDAATADRRESRGAYAGQPALGEPALAQWRAQQAGQGAAGLQQLATAQTAAFTTLTPVPLRRGDPALADPQAGWSRWRAPLDGSAPGRHFLRLRAVDEAGNHGPFGPATLPIVVPDLRRPSTPALRRVSGADRSVWVHWDAAPGAVAYRVLRAERAAGSEPDARDMALVVTLVDAGCPEPVAVFGGVLRIPGPAPASLVAVFRAEDYNAAVAPDAQAAAPLGGAVLAGTTVTGLGLSDGTLVFAVVRFTAGGTPALLAAAGRAWRDGTAEPGHRHQYRVEAVRDAAVGPNTTVPVLSFASEVGEGEAFDPRPPVPPAATAAWSAGTASVHVTWSAADLPAGLELRLQRARQGGGLWRQASGWVPASSGAIDDADVSAGEAYAYRLQARNPSGRMSEPAAAFATVTVP